MCDGGQSSRLRENLPPRPAALQKGLSPAFVRRHKPDLVLLDVNMPGLDGTAACKLLRGDPETAGVVITLYSSMDEDELRSRAVACGADGFIRETDDVRGLVTTIEGLLARTAHRRG